MDFTKISLFWMILFIATLSFGQKTKTYNSQITMGGKNYQARYDYFVENGDTLFHGPFSLSQEIEEAEGENLFNFSAINGNFKENTPHGEWMLRQGSFRPSGKGAFKDYSYSFNIHGNEFLAKGSFENGKKNSPWQIYEWNITNSNIEDTLFSASIPFKNDRIRGKFRLFENGEHLEGSVGKDELAMGKWQFFTTDSEGNKVLLKEWLFEDNQFASKSMYANGDSIEINLNLGLEEDSLLEEVELDRNFLEIIDLKAALENPETIDKYRDEYRVRDLFFSTMEKFQAVDTTFSPILGNKIAPKIYTKLERFPYTQREKTILTNFESKTQKADSALKRIKNDPQINLARISTMEVAYYISVLHAIEGAFIKPNREILGHFKSGNLEYINREKFVGTRLNEPLEKLDVAVSFNNDTTNEEYTLQEINKNTGDNSIENAGKLADAIIAEIQILRDSIDIYIEEIKREENLTELEGILIDKYDRVKHLNDSLIGTKQNNVAGFDVNQSIASFADETLKAYSNIETTNEKMNQVEPSLECLNQVEELIKVVHKAPDNSFTVRDAYTKKVFNPYTSTEMEEKVKSSIYKSFEEVLLPAVLGNVQNLRCNNVSGFTDNFNLLFEGMIEILKKDTGREERKVKRTKTPSRVSDILNLNLRF